MKTLLAVVALGLAALAPAAAEEEVVPFDRLVAHEVKLRPELAGVHPRVFVTAQGLEALRERARSTHKAEWNAVLGALAALAGDPPPPPGPQARRSQNDVAFAIAEISLAYAVERKPAYLAAARRWVLAAIDYEPWGYTNYKPNVDLAAGHLLYAIGWSYDLLHDDFTEAERKRIRGSLARHARLVYDNFKPQPNKDWSFSQNHTYIPATGLAVTALALLGEEPEAPRWAALARALHHRLGQCLSPDGYFYEGFEYWIFCAPWIVHFLDAWEHATGESLWDRPFLGGWGLYVAHTILPDGQNIFDFADAWEGALTRAGQGDDYPRVVPGGRLRSNYNLLYRVAARRSDTHTRWIAERLRAAGHTTQEEHWTLLWRDPEAAAAAPPPIHHFADSGVVFYRTDWTRDATAFAFKAGPPEGHRAATLLKRMPEWTLSDGHVHPDNGSFIVYARGRYLTGDSGYSGLTHSDGHNTITVNGAGQGEPKNRHNIWAGMAYDRLATVRLTQVEADAKGARIVAEVAGAYPEATTLRRFTRTFTFDGADRFRVQDQVELGAPGTVQWRLNSDGPITPAEKTFVLGAPKGATLEAVAAAPSDATATIRDLVVRAPGPPNAISEGPQMVRGRQLVLENPEPKTAVSFDVGLRVQ